MESIFYGFLVIFLGLGLMLLTLFLARSVPKSTESKPLQRVPLTLPEVDPSGDAIFLVEEGGRIIYSNEKAQEWLGSGNHSFNLERLSRRAQPSETFLSICLTEGRARFNLDGHLVEGVSYKVPVLSAVRGQNGDGKSSMLVSLQKPKITALLGEDATFSYQTLDIFSKLTQKMVANLDQETTIQSILESVERIIPCDRVQIGVWNRESEELLPYSFVGAQGVNRRITTFPKRVSSHQGYSGNLIKNRKPLLIPRVKDNPIRASDAERDGLPYASYMGVPLSADGEFVGTLELSSLIEDSLTENEFEILKVIAGPASLALSNAIKFGDNQKRVVELSGLTNLFQSVSSLSDVQDLFTILVDEISRVVPATILGFLLYKETHQILEAQSPFKGIPEQFLNLYRVEITPGSPADEILTRQNMVIVEDAESNSILKELGLDSMAVASGIQNMVLVPLKMADRTIGYLQAANRADNQPFSKDDIRLLGIIARQAAAIIDNMMQMKQSQNRAQRAETLRRVASLTGSTATLDEILTHSLREIVRLLRAEKGIIFLLDEYIGELQPHLKSMLSDQDHTQDTLVVMSMTNPRFKETVTFNMEPIFLADLTTDGKLPPFYRSLLGKIDVNSALILPFVVRGQGVGEMIIGSQETSHFDQNDLTLVSTTASQLSIAVEKSALYGQTDESLRRRVVQLLALNRISRELSTTLELKRLIQVVYEQVLETTEADCGSIFLFEHQDEIRIPPKISFVVGDSDIVSLTPIEGRVLFASEPYIVKDYLSPDPKVPDTMPVPPHPDVRSSLIVPIAFQDSIAGLIHLHAQTPNRFDSTSKEIAQSLAVQAAIAIGNAKRFQEQIERNDLLNRRIETMTALLETTQYLKSGQPLEESLDTIAFGIQSATPFECVLISLFRDNTKQLHRIASAGIPLDVFADLQKRTQTWSGIKGLLRDEYIYGNCYFIPKPDPESIPPELHVEILNPSGEYSVELEGDIWDPSDLLFIPLLTSDGIPLGLIRVDHPRNGLRPDQHTFESLEIFANQASLVIETFNEINRLTEKSADLDAQIKKFRKEIETSQKILADQIKNEKSQTNHLVELNHRFSRLSSCLSAAVGVDHFSDREELLLEVSRHLLKSDDFKTVLVGELVENSPSLIHVVGNVPKRIKPEALLGQRNPLRTSLLSGQLIFDQDVHANDTWVDSPLIRGLDAGAFISLPIPNLGFNQEDSDLSAVDAVLLVISDQPMVGFGSQDEEIFALLTRQTAVSLQNLRVIKDANHRLGEMNLLLEFSRQLGSFDKKAILGTLIENVNKAVPAGQACMVGLWSQERQLIEPVIAVGYPDNEKMMRISYQSGSSLPGKVFVDGHAVNRAEVEFTKDYDLDQDQLLLYRDATLGQLPLSSLVVPLDTYESVLGVLVLDNFREVSAFDQDDQALISALTRQTALTLENVQLYDEAETRANQLQALTKVAETITSSLQSDELIQSLLEQLRNVVPFDTGTLWLRGGEQMTVRAAVGGDASEDRLGISVALEDSLLLREMATTNSPLSVKDVREDNRFPSLVEQRFLSWLGVPLLSKGDVVGVIVLEKVEPGFYSSEYIQSTMTFASQASVALENANLYEDSIQRATELDERTQRLSMLNRLSTELSTSLNLSHILTVLADEILQAAGGDMVSVGLLDGEGIVSIFTQEPELSKSLPLVLPGCPIFERIKESLGVFSTENTEQEHELDEISGYLESTNTKSLLIVPLISGNNLIGMTIIHSQEEHYFGPDEVALAVTINNQVAVAIQNARLFQETERLIGVTQQRSVELTSLYDLGVRFTQVLDQARLLDITFENVSHLLSPDAITVALVNNDDQITAFIQDHGQRRDGIKINRNHATFDEYVIETNQPLLIEDSQSAKLPIRGKTIGEECRSWLGVPLVVRGVSKGSLSIQSDQPSAFGETQQGLLGQIANQLSVALDNAQLFRTVQSYTEELEERVSERTEQLEQEHRRIQTLLSITTELSASLEMDMVLNRTLGVVNETIDAEESSILLTQPDNDYLYLRASLGISDPIPSSGIISDVKNNEGVAGWSIANRQPVLVKDLHKDFRWEKRTSQLNLHRSAMVVPLMVGEEILGVLMVYHRQPNVFDTDQLDLIQAVAKQIAIALNNAQLYNLIRDQAERLGDMLRTQHVETSRSQAILEAVADGVLVTDSHRRITLFNASAENILGMTREEVLGRNLEHFIGLFGKAAQSWVQTIRLWSQDPDSYELGDTYQAQIELDDRSVVSVHLSPVHLSGDFLGTVSVFRDITHQVEVDRLKSEFVATVSHELRTPMTSIKGYVEVLLMGAAGELNSQQTHFLDVVQSNTERLAVLVNDLLDVSRIEAGKVVLSRQPVDMRIVTDEIISSTTEKMVEDNRILEIRKEIPADIPLVNGDPERVRQILDNLVENAIQYTPAGGKIEIVVYQVEHMVQVDVIDNGIGIKPEDQDRIFERFFRGEDPLVLATSGTGLGLSIVKTLVEMHGGKIWFESEGIPGRGSKFSFVMPVFDPDEVDSFDEGYSEAQDKKDKTIRRLQKGVSKDDHEEGSDLIPNEYEKTDDTKGKPLIDKDWLIS